MFMSVKPESAVEDDDIELIRLSLAELNESTLDADIRAARLRATTPTDKDPT